MNNQENTQVQSGKFLDFMNQNETAEFVGFSRNKIWRWRKSGAFPEPYRTSAGDVLGWTKPQLMAWKQSLFAMAA